MYNNQVFFKYLAIIYFNRILLKKNIARFVNNIKDTYRNKTIHHKNNFVIAKCRSELIFIKILKYSRLLM